MYMINRESDNQVHQEAGVGIFADDLLQREEIAKRILEILISDVESDKDQKMRSNLDSFFPMLIDGNWGSGKTFLCRKLEQYISFQRQNGRVGFQTIYIDAFENDHTDNPLFVLLSQIIQHINTENKTNTNNTSITKTIKKIRDAGGKIIWAMTRNLSKAGSLSIIEAIVESICMELLAEPTTNNAVLKGTLENIQNSIKQTIEKSFQKEEAKTQNITSFKQDLANYAAEKPLVILIDELDRCKPAFAMDMLEVIKHIFDVPNVKFILFTYERQLEEAIKHRYGPLIDSQRYLDKFLRFRVQLPSQTYQSSELVSNTYKYLEELMKQTPLIHKDSNIKPMLNNFLKFMISLHNISLRTAETIIRYCNLYLKLKGKSSIDRDLEVLLFYTIILYVINPELCMKIVNRKATPEEISSFLGLDNIISSNTALHGNAVSLSTRWALALMTEFPDFSRMQSIIDLNAKSTPYTWEAISNVAYKIGVGPYLYVFKQGDQTTANGQLNKIRQLISDIALY